MFVKLSDNLILNKSAIMSIKLITRNWTAKDTTYQVMIKYRDNITELLNELEITVKSVNGEYEARFPKTSSTRKYLFAVAQFKEMDKLTEAEIKKFYEIFRFV